MPDTEEEDFFDAVNVKRPKPLSKVAGRTFLSVACGGLHNLAIEKDSGDLYSWGCSDNEVLGRGGDENLPFPVVFSTQMSSMATPCRIIQVSAGDKHSCALDPYGNVYAWGTYGDKDGKNWFLKPDAKAMEESFGYCQKTPMKVEVSQQGKQAAGAEQIKFVEIASGANHTLALDKTGRVYSWGIGDIGQLGRPVCVLKDENYIYKKKQVVEQHLIPKEMSFADSALKQRSVRSIACGNGGYHSFVITASNEVFGCGLNQYSQLALPFTQNPVNKLTEITNLKGKHVKMVKAGEHFSLALTLDGFVYSFGRCDQSQLGISLEDANSEGKREAGAFFEEPQLVLGKDSELKDKVIVTIACGSAHSLLLTDKKECYSFGFGDSNQLGHGKAADEIYPRKIMKLEGQQNSFATKTPVISSFSCGGQHSVVLVE